MRIGSMNKTTVVIKTFGRKTLKNAVESSRREGFTTLVISDGADINIEELGDIEYVQLGKKWGYYGGMAANVGAALVKTEFITFLDDDDEFVPGAGDIIRKKLEEKPEVDVWVGGVRFCSPISVRDMKTGVEQLSSRDLAMSSDLGVVPGNVAMPTYRTSIFSKLPFMDSVPPHQLNLTDFIHIHSCKNVGYTVDWFGGPIYLVRPGTSTLNGRGV